MKLSRIIFSISYLACLLSTLNAQSIPFVLPYTPKGITHFDPKIPTPEAVLGYQVGSKHTRPEEVVRYFEAVAATSNRITLRTYGKSYEGRPLVVATITTPVNHTNLASIRQKNLQLVKEPERIDEGALKNMPAVWYAGYSVHGNEASGTDAALLFLYYLAAGQGPEIEAILSKMIILVDPCMNPDGRARFVDHVNRMRGAVPNDDGNDAEHNEPWPGGRTNKYWFDLNRDWVLAVHPESVGRIETFYQWRPQLLTDHHEMGSESTFFFQPGIPASTNPLTPQGNVTLTERLATFHARFLDQIGSLYYTRENYDDFYYGKGSTFPDINGAVGILFEQGSSRALLRETSSGTLPYAQTVLNQFVTSLSSMNGLSSLREDFLRHQHNFYREAKDLARSNPVKGYILDDSRYPNRTAALVNMLMRHDVIIHRLKGTSGDIKRGYVIPMDQPQIRLLKGIMEKTTSFRDSLFYDISTWTMPLAFGVPYQEATTSIQSLLGEQLNAPLAKIGQVFGNPPQTIAYLMPWGDYNAPKAVYQLQKQGILVRMSKLPFTLAVDGKQQVFERGTIIIPVLPENQARLMPTIKAIAASHGVDFYATETGYTPDGPDLGSNNMPVLSMPKVGLFQGSGVNSNNAGEVWHLLSERMAMPVSLLNATDLPSLNLNRYNVLILSEGSYPNGTAEKLKTWVAEGNTLIALQGAMQWAIRNNLTDEKVKETKAIDLRNVPFEDLARTRGAQNIAGAIFEARLDLTHPLAFGQTEKMAFFKTSETLYALSNVPGATVARYTEKPYISGYVSDEMLQEVKGSAALLSRKQGRGNVVLFADNPNFRGFWYALNGLMLNAIFFGRSY